MFKTRFEVEEDDELEQSMRMAALHLDMVHQQLGEDPSELAGIAQKRNDRSAKSSCGYARGRGICSTREALEGFSGPFASRGFWSASVIFTLLIPF